MLRFASSRRLVPRTIMVAGLCLVVVGLGPAARALGVGLDAEVSFEASSEGSSGAPSPPTPSTRSSSMSIPAAAPTASGADLHVTKADSADPVTVGGTFTYTIVVENEGDANANGFSVTDALPSGVTYVSSSPANRCTHSGGTVTCSTSNGRLNAGADITFTITVQATQAGNVTNTASASTTSGDVDPSDDSDSETTTLRTTAPGQLICTAGPSGVTIDWESVPQATTYNVYRAAGATGTPDYVLLGSTSETEFLDTTAAVGQAYRYRVTAVAAGVESEPSPPCAIASVPELPTLAAGALAVVGGVAALRYWKRP